MARIAGDPAFARHDLVDADPDAWAALLAARSDLAGIPHLPGWACAGHPFVVRRFHPGEPRDAVPLGLPLPPADGKRRIGLSLPPSVLTRRRSPSLAETRAAAPPAWRPILDALVRLSDESGVPCRPFGSLLWQALTGLPYLAPGSDLDLLWTLPADAAAGPLLDGLARIEEQAPMRLDGEVLLPDGSGLHWREWHVAPPDGSVLAKRIDGLAMQPVASLPSL
ncbi:MAG: malonate decarboxylase holo-[acyl-carrier-protein] synthase [Methylobacterium sp. CG08_land_8_20_14_0_20_71_15]|nr:MAG: malonate decarboxylase holo-[acyl-carrier-protein] synthase [Methylobacterium sp. CG09_land_8_20_14_0_10_71_15]PIU14879.1 MAG: malonate decarboxylase holo-[acyl-carrier-protein] synthase [Methylobacterium sp. CG08_land_8_20_14_0_20_71_15]